MWGITVDNTVNVVTKPAADGTMVVINHVSCTGFRARNSMSAVPIFIQETKKNDDSSPNMGTTSQQNTGRRRGVEVVDELNVITSAFLINFAGNRFEMAHTVLLEKLKQKIGRRKYYTTQLTEFQSIKISGAHI